MATTRICLRCRKPVSSFAPDGLCPNCLLDGGLTDSSCSPGDPDLPTQAAEPSPLPVGRGEGQGEGPRGYPLPSDGRGAGGEGHPPRLRYFGDYELLEEIARGGMGVVYKARQVSLNRTVAVKMILSGQLAGAAEIQRFRHEAEAVANLQHPNIVAIHEIGEHEGHQYFSMDYVEGKDLGELVRDGPLPAKRAAAYVKTIAEAIHYAHGKGVLHRDLKPSNVLIDVNDQPRVTDFGLAKRLNVGQASRLPSAGFTLAREAVEARLATPEEAGETPTLPSLTLSGQVLGTPNYMPPEQARGRRREIGPPSDVFSLGGILYFLLTGRPPFLGESLEETLSQLLHAEPVSPHLLNPSVPRDLETICLKCLEKETTRRYQTALALTEELERFLHNEPVRARPVGPLGRLGRWCRRKPAIAGLSSAALLIFLAGFAGVLWQWQRAERNATAEANQRERAEQAVTRLEIERAESFFASDNASKALAYLARLLRQQPTNRVVAERLISALSQRAFCLPAAPPLRHDALVTSSAFAPSNDASRLIMEFVRHDGSISMGSFSPDGRRVVTASKDATARIWDTRAGLPAGEPLKHRAEVLWAQFSADGRRIVTASLDKTARIWDAQTGLPTLPPLQHDGAVLFAEFSPDGRKVVTASEDTTVRLWDAETGRPFSISITNQSATCFARFSPDGNRLLVHSLEGAARVWDCGTGVKIASFSQGFIPHNAAAPFPQFSPDGERVVTFTGSETLIWDIRDKKTPVARLKHGNQVNGVEFSPDGQRVATASRDNAARVWDARAGEALTPPLKHASWVSSAHFSADGQRLVTSSRDRSARLWDVRTGKPLTEPLRHDSGVWDARFSSDGRYVLTISGGNAAWLWDIRCAQPLTARLRHARDVQHAAFSPDGRRIATGSFDGTARLWDARTGHPLTAPLKQGGLVYSVQFGPDGKRVVTTTDAGNAQVWEVAGGKPVAGPLRHTDGVYYARFSPDGRRVVTASLDKGAGIWDSDTGALLTRLEHDRQVRYAEFSPDGHRVVTASVDQTARVWDSHTGQPLSDPLRHDGEVYWAQFSPDGQRVVTASQDKTARIWDARTGRLAIKPLDHADELSREHSVQFSPDGWWVATAAGHAAQIWDARTGRPVSAGFKHDGLINSVRFSPDGKRIVTASYDGTARVWDASTAHPVSEPLRHDANEHVYAEFSPDGRYVLTASMDATARIWEVPPAPLPIPDWLAELAEAVAGESIDFDGISAVVPVEELFRLKQRLNERVGNGYYDNWVRWFLAGSATRALSPSSAITVPDYVQRRIEENTEKSLREAVQLAPTNVAALSRLALAVWGQKSTAAPAQKAESDWLISRAVALAPDNPDVCRTRAEILRHQGKTLEALQMIDRLLAHTPENSESWHFKGQMLEKNNRLDEACQAYARALTQTDANSGSAKFRNEALSRRANLLVRLKRFTEAKADFEKLVAADFLSADQCNALAWNLVAGPVGGRDPALALLLAEEAVQLEPKNWMWQNTLGVACYRAREYRKSVEALLRNVKLRPDGLGCHDLIFLAMSHHQLDELEKAKEYYEQTLRWRDTHPNAPPHWLHELKVFQAEAESLLGLRNSQRSTTEPPSSPTAGARQFPPRDPSVSPTLIDLSAYYNVPLDREWQDDNSKGVFSLSQLPRGVHLLDGVEFDIRGVVLLLSSQLRDFKMDYPTRLDRIPVGRKCRRVHFLHAASWSETPGTEIGSYQLRFAEGEPLRLPIVHAEDVKYTVVSANSTPPSRATVAWTGTNSPGSALRLFRTTWENPRPKAELSSIDFVSEVKRAAPFLVAITAE